MKNINSLLIANRGEIASRIIRTCRKMGIKSIAVFSEADRQAPFVEQADTAIYIGPSDPTQSYLDINQIIAAAQKTGAQAIHPGYGFLSENADFARRCQADGLIFVGPNPEAIEAMGSKSSAKALMQQHGVPLVPGYQGEDQRPDKFIEEAQRIGYPVLLKAVAGGGGKGMRIVREEQELPTAFAAAQREARNAFGNDELLLEKYIDSGRHIEFQIFGDQSGQAIHLLERECTIQRRYQKIIEESPSPALDAALREEMGAVAVSVAQALKYDNAGTVEFIFDEVERAFYFLEVNTRLQVEHPITEEITGFDLVQWQIEVAQGLPLPITQEAVNGKGYAIEVRLYAEDPANQFLPVTGTIERFEAPQVEGLRVESAIRSGSAISVYYDPMIAKLIVWDQNRAAAQRKMQYVLRHLLCLGTTTNQAFLLQLLENTAFQQGQYDTHFIEKHFPPSSSSTLPHQALEMAAMAATLYDWKQRDQTRTLLRSMPSGWRNNFYTGQKEVFNDQDQSITLQYRYLAPQFQFTIAEQSYEVHLLQVEATSIRLEIDGQQYEFHLAIRDQEYFIQQESFGTIHLQQQGRFPVKEKEKVKGGLEAPMPSQVVKVLVESGQEVQAGDGLMVLSSMKMESTIYAETAGQVEEIYAAEGAHVEAGYLLLKINES